jgi:uncharacterized coiled-coil protein SlyX
LNINFERKDMKKYIITTFLAAGVLALSGVALAQTESAGAKPKADKASAALTKIITKADAEIARRMESLNALTTRVNEMKKIGETDKAGLIQKIKTVQDDLTALKTKIDSATDLATLREDAKSITSSYRVYMLVLPQVHVLAAADRMDAIIASLTAVGVKLNARILEAQTAGKDTAALQKLMDDFNAQLADARKQTDAAKGHVSGLVPDEGDASVQKTNASELKIARADIKVAHEDFTNARKDAEGILKGLKDMGYAKPSATGTTTPPVAQ